MVLNKARVEFKGSCLKQDKNSYNQGKMVKVYIVYEIKKKLWYKQLFNIRNVWLFGAVKLTKHPDIYQYKCFGYGIVFDRKGFFHILVLEMVKM